MNTVLVDRAWAQNLGLNQISGAQRVGNFYRLPRNAYLRAVGPGECGEVPVL